MFSRLRKYKYILVTGPQRSGTTIVTHMIAHDTGKVALDEVVFNHRDIKEIPGILRREKTCVLQCPQALPWMPILTSEDTAIICVKRDIDEIKRSIENSYSPKGKKISIPWFTPEQAYLLWFKIKPLLHYPYEINYNSIKKHPFYLPPQKRKYGWNHKSVNKGHKRIDRWDYGTST